MLIKLFRFFSHFPISFMHKLGSLMGLFIYWCSPRYRQHLRANIQRAGFPDALPKAIREMGKSVFELPFIWYAPQERAFSHVYLNTENWELVQSTYARKHGIIFLTPHMGCFEILAKYVSTKIDLTVMFKPPKIAALRPLFEGARARDDLKLAPTNLTGVRTMLRALKKGEAIGLLPDQVPPLGDGVWADFFDRPAYTMTLAVKLHQLTGAPILMSYAERLPEGKGYELHFSLFEEPLGDTVEEQARAVNLAMEKLISRCPSQYFWNYNRYKGPSASHSTVPMETEV